MALDPLADVIYELTFTNRFLKARGSAFQDLFVSVMERAHPGDFIPVQAWGNIGDLKNDGYLTSQRMIFQCYGPKDFENESKPKAKVRADFRGALKHWRTHMDAWTFVHNDPGGCPSFLVQILVGFRARHGEVTVGHWGLPELLLAMRRLALPDLVALFGQVPSSRDVMSLRQQDFRDVLPALAGAIAMTLDDPQVDVRPVPPEKLEFNKLTEAARALLTMGMHASDRVREFFGKWEVGVGDRIIAGFNARYRQLRAEATRTPDEILWELYEFAGRRDVATTRENATVVALLAYLFEICEIFERPQHSAAQ